MSETKTDKLESKPMLDKLAKVCGHQRNTFYTGALNCEKCYTEKLEKENAELKEKLTKGQESFELVLDNTVSDKAIISLLCDALNEATDNHIKYVETKNLGWFSVTKYRALAKQHKHG